MGINKDGDPLGAASVNFTGTDTHGKIGINAAVGTRVLEATETTSPGIVANFKSTASGAGSKLLLSNSVDAASVNQSQGLGFSTMLGSTETVTWFGGTFRPNGGANNYFALNYVGATFAADSQYEIDTTLTNNEMYLDSSGNVTFRGNVAGVNFNASGNVAGDAFYDKGGTTVGNYCRGRFLQTFSIGIKADKTGPVFPALNTVLPGLSSLYEGYVDTGARTPDAQYMSRAPHNGKLVQVDLTVYFPPGQVNVAGEITPILMFYSGSSLPSADGNAGMGTTNSAHKTTATLSDSTSYTLGYDTSTFTDTASVLEFSEGDYLAFSIDTNSTTGWFYSNLALTFEFEID